jgi:3-oxoacyl-[acyl-carrier-protein] synthase II
LNDLRPTLFLAQLANLMAGNISIVHGVTGSSRTFMGEEAPALDSVRIAHARIAAGQSELAAGRRRKQRRALGYSSAISRLDARSRTTSIRTCGSASRQLAGWSSAALAAFLVLEEKQHALDRGAKPIARLARLRIRYSKAHCPARSPRALERMWSDTAGKVRPENAGHPLGRERHRSRDRGGAAPFSPAIRALPYAPAGTHLGHAPESQFPANIALAAAAIQRGKLYPACDGSGMERPMDAPLRQVVVTSVGHRRGECLALVEAVE